MTGANQASAAACVAAVLRVSSMGKISSMAHAPCLRMRLKFRLSCTNSRLDSFAGLSFPHCLSWSWFLLVFSRLGFGRVGVFSLFCVICGLDVFGWRRLDPVIRGQVRLVSLYVLEVC